MALPKSVDLAVECFDGALQARVTGWVGIEHRSQRGMSDNERHERAQNGVAPTIA